MIYTSGTLHVTLHVTLHYDLIRAYYDVFRPDVGVHKCGITCNVTCYMLPLHAGVGCKRVIYKSVTLHATLPMAHACIYLDGR